MKGNEVFTCVYCGKKARDMKERNCSSPKTPTGRHAPKTTQAAPEGAALAEASRKLAATEAAYVAGRANGTELDAAAIAYGAAEDAHYRA